MSRSYLSSAAMALAILVALPAAAQEKAATPDAGQSANDGSTIDDITVTAQRRQEKLQSVPIAITAFDAGGLADRQIRQTVDLTHFVPNMVGHSNTSLGTANVYYIRGLGNTESIGTFDPPVGTYIDDVYVARQNLNNFSLFDVERIEVLRGPQGTLFGRNTTGGAIDIILKKPSDHVGGYAEADYGSFNAFGGRASIDVPLSEKVLTKISAFGHTDDGYVTQLSTGRKLNGLGTYGVRGAIRFLPTDALTWDVVADHIYESYANVVNVVDANGHRVSHGGIVKGALANFFVGPKGGLDPYTNKVTSTAITSNITYDTGGVSLQSITGYRTTGQDFLVDSFGELAAGATATGAVPNATSGRYTQFSQEFKAVGKLLDDRLGYTVGLYYMKEHVRTDLAGGSTNAVTGVFTVTGDRTVVNTTDAKAVYAQFDYTLLPKLVLTVGGRYTDEVKHFAADRNPGALGAAISTAAIAAAGIPLRLRTPLFTPHFGLQYNLSPDVNFYATATRGFKSGGWNARALNNAAFTTFTPEKIWSEELGMRADLFNRTLRFNVTGFYSYDSAFQVPAAVFVNNSPIYTTTNPADLQVYGGEFEMTWLPVRHLTINSSLGLSSAKYKNPTATVVAQEAACKANPGTTANSNCNAGFVDIYGNLATPVRTPKVTWNVFASYEVDTGPLIFTPSADFSLYSPYAIGTTGSEAAFHSGIAAAAGTWVSSQSLLNMALKIQPSIDKNLSFTVECQNCLLKNYPVSFLPPLQYLDKPGTWTVRAHLDF